MPLHVAWVNVTRSGGGTAIAENVIRKVISAESVASGGESSAATQAADGALVTAVAADQYVDVPGVSGSASAITGFLLPTGAHMFVKPEVGERISTVDA